MARLRTVRAFVSPPTLLILRLTGAPPSYPRDDEQRPAIVDDPVNDQRSV